jgi:hypothetical protein
MFAAGPLVNNERLEADMNASIVQRAESRAPALSSVPARDAQHASP